MKHQPFPLSLRRQLTLCNIKQLAKETGMAQSALQHWKLGKHAHKIHIAYLSALLSAVKDHLDVQSRA